VFYDGIILETYAGQYGETCYIYLSISTENKLKTSLVTLCQSSGKSIISYLSTETAEVFRVLANFNLLDLFTKTGTITGAVFADDANLLCALRLQALRWDGED